MKKLFFTLLSSISLFGAQAQQKFDAHQLLTDIKILSSDEYEGRKTGTPGSLKAQEYILKRFIEYKLMPFNGNYKQPFSFESKSKTIEGSNLIGYIEGKSKDKGYILVYGHYDHLGVIDNQIYNGADDNASGVAGMFAVADYYQKNTPEHTIIFIAFDAEELGLQGAAYFAKNLPVPKEKILAGINMDMISRNDKNQLYASGTHHYPFLKSYIHDAAKVAKIEVLFGHDHPDNKTSGQDDWTFASDHAKFHQVGIPYVYFGVEDHKDYHRETDEFQTINQVFFVNCVDFIIDVVKQFDSHFDKLMKEKTDYQKHHHPKGNH